MRRLIFASVLLGNFILQGCSVTKKETYREPTLGSFVHEGHVFKGKIQARGEPLQIAAKPGVPVQIALPAKTRVISSRRQNDFECATRGNDLFLTLKKIVPPSPVDIVAELVDGRPFKIRLFPQEDATISHIVVYTAPTQAELIAKQSERKNYAVFIKELQLFDETGIYPVGFQNSIGHFDKLVPSDHKVRAVIVKSLASNDLMVHKVRFENLTDQFVNLSDTVIQDKNSQVVLLSERRLSPRGLGEIPSATAYLIRESHK